MKAFFKGLSCFLAMTAIVSCVSTMEQDVEVIPEDNGPSLSEDYGTVTMSAGDFIWETPQTKTILDDAGKFFWKSSDIVGIIPDEGTQVKFPIDAEDGTQAQSAEFNGGAWALKKNSHYMAYYPFISDMDLDKTQVPVDFRNQQQQGIGNTDHLSTFDFMAAAGVVPENDNINFSFDHLSSLLRLNLTVPKVGEYKTLTLHCDDHQFITAGTVDMSQPNPCITATHSSNDFVINLRDFTTTVANQTVVIYVLIPPVDMSGRRIHIRLMGDHADCETHFDRPDHKPFEAGHAYAPTIDNMAGGDVIQLENGHQFNEDIKSLVNGEHFIYEKTDYRIKSVSFEVDNGAVPPAGYSYVDVSASDSPAPIYAYWKPEDDELVIRTPVLKVYANGDASGMFNKLDQLTSIDFTGFDLTYTNSVASMFFECHSLENLDLSPWNSSGVSDFHELFMECKKLSNLNISNLNVSSALSLGMMFGGCRSLQSLNLTHFNTPNLQDPGYMFYLCESLESVSFGNQFNTSNVERFDGMFCGCKSLQSVDISMFDMSNAKSYWRLFEDCNALEEITGSIPVTRGTDVGEMYMGCFALEEINVSSWDLSETTSLNNTFSGCHTITTLDVSNWSVANIEDFTNAFSDCYALSTLNVSDWNTSSATSMYRMFANCTSLSTLDVSHFITNGVKSFGGMFAGCTGLTSLDVSNFNTESVQEAEFMGSGFGGMFSGCTSLESLDVSSFSTGSANSLIGMFGDCSSLTSLNLSNFDMSRIITMRGLFGGCSSLTSIVFGTFDTHYCEDFNSMFKDCSSLTSLDLSFFNTSAAKNMADMFLGCSSMNSLNLSSFDTSHLTSSMGAFIRDCHKLQELRLGTTFEMVGPWYFATDLARDVLNCTIYCTQDFKDAWLTTEGVYGPDSSKLTWLSCSTGEPLN